MNSKLTITIKRRTQPEWLIWLIIMMPFLFGTLFDLLSIPSALKYLLDISWVLLLIFLFLKHIENPTPDKKNRILFIWIISFFVFTFLVYIFNYQSVFYYAWGLRNNFRFYIAILAFITFLKKSDIAYYLSIFDKIFWINAVVCLIQYFVFGFHGDWLGGVFGTEAGCNAYTNVFFVIVSIKSIVYYLNKAEGIWSCIAKCGTMMAIAALAEIKFFYIEFVLIVAVAVLLVDFTWRKLLVILGGVIGVLAGAYILVIIFPNSAGFLEIETIWKIASSEAGYTSSGDLNRLTAVPIISERFLTTIPQKLFGLGLGNCDAAGYSFLISPFYARYSYLRYQWFSIAFLFLEMGYIGLFFFNLFFILVFLKSRRVAAETVQDKIYSQIAAIASLCCILIAIYNSSLRTEAGYMAYFVLSLPFIRREKPQSHQQSLHEKYTPKEVQEVNG